MASPSGPGTQEEGPSSSSSPARSTKRVVVELDFVPPEEPHSARNRVLLIPDLRRPGARDVLQLEAALWRLAGADGDLQRRVREQEQIFFTSNLDFVFYAYHSDLGTWCPLDKDQPVTIPELTHLRVRLQRLTESRSGGGSSRLRPEQEEDPTPSGPSSSGRKRETEDERRRREAFEKLFFEDDDDEAEREAERMRKERQEAEAGARWRGPPAKAHQREEEAAPAVAVASDSDDEDGRLMIDVSLKDSARVAVKDEDEEEKKDIPEEDYQGRLKIDSKEIKASAGRELEDLDNDDVGVEMWKEILGIQDGFDEGEGNEIEEDKEEEEEEVGKDEPKDPRQDQAEGSAEAADPLPGKSSPSEGEAKLEEGDRKLDDTEVIRLDLEDTSDESELEEGEIREDSDEKEAEDGEQEEEAVVDSSTSTSSSEEEREEEAEVEEEYLGPGGDSAASPSTAASPSSSSSLSEEEKRESSSRSRRRKRRRSRSRGTRGESKRKKRQNKRVRKERRRRERDGSEDVESGKRRSRRRSNFKFPEGNRSTSGCGYSSTQASSSTVVWQRDEPSSSSSAAWPPRPSAWDQEYVSPWENIGPGVTGAFSQGFHPEEQRQGGQQPSPWYSSDKYYSKSSSSMALPQTGFPSAMSLPLPSPSFTPLLPPSPASAALPPPRSEGDVLASTLGLQGRDPMQALMVLCDKKRWKRPIYCLHDQSLEAGLSTWKWKVLVEGRWFHSPRFIQDKARSKQESAQACLQELGIPLL